MIGLVQRSRQLSLVLGFGVGLVVTASIPVWADEPTGLPTGRPVTSLLQEGQQILVNGQRFPGAWGLWTNPQSGQTSIGVSDAAWVRYLGGDFLDNTVPSQQPVQWYSPPLMLSARSNGATRYLDITGAAQRWEWQLHPQGTVLDIRTPPAMVQMIRLGQQPWGRRLVLTLDRPAPWTMASLTNSRTGRTDRQFSLQVDATPSSTALQGFTAAPGNGLKALKIAPGQGQTAIKGVLEGRFAPQVWTIDNPPRLVIDVRQTPLKTRLIRWSPGVEWREAMVSLGESQFPVTWLALNPRQSGLRIQPIWGNPAGLLGITAPGALAQQHRVAAAINAGFFSRDRQTPLGAIRRNGTWLSSPILGRGAIGWDGQGQFRVGRLMLQETVTAGTGQTWTIVSSNSGYPQKGIARYTKAWGSTYTPLLQNEQIVTVVGQQVQGSQPSKKDVAIPIPGDGYLLVVRGMALDASLSVGLQVDYRMNAALPAFAAMPDIVGAGPLLVDNGRIVADAIAEQFSKTFAQQAADRSAIGQTADGTLLLAVTHNRVGGAGPTLTEWAQLMRQLGAVNALNLDGGSSTALYLGGQLLDRHPATAARIHNSIGVFVPPY
jgi:uncharacterized protein YigE (DUF2233 family)